MQISATDFKTKTSGSWVVIQFAEMDAVFETLLSLDGMRTGNRCNPDLFRHRTCAKKQHGPLL